jgi:hypothetical protein
MKLAFSVLAAACAFAAAPPVHAYVLKKTPSGSVVHWNAAEARLTVDPSVAGAEPRAREAIATAAGRWNAQSHGAPRIVVAAGEKAGEPGLDKVNGIFFRSTFAPAGGAIAVTVVSYEQSSGTILDADIVLTGRYSYSASEEIERDHYDLVHIVAHEQGHWLGLGDENQLPGVLMYSATKSGQTLRREPSDDDLAGVAAIYDGRTPSPAPATAYAGCNITGSRSTLAGGAFALFSLGLVLAARRRRAGLVAFALVSAGSAATVSSRAATSEGAPAAAPVRLAAEVIGHDTRWEGGLLRTEVRLRTTGGASSEELHVQMWGGSRDGITQEIGEEPVPIDGAHVRLLRAEGMASARIVR